MTIACHLAKEAKHPELLGDSAESRAVVQQWLEHRVTKLDGCKKEDVKTVLKVAMLLVFYLKKSFVPYCILELLIRGSLRIEPLLPAYFY